ncbi:MAG: putative N-acetyl-alpha-D-glucosaminyl L-malate deacetylase 2 [Anaerolineales bacterium]|nr:putative N-acetyl-alpha-D-glucosaminyl L-malate deacetylase 2 [Anaerolineales bacterium]
MFKDKMKTILVFAPHPDDETLGCGGTIVKRLKEGYKVKLIVLTDGSHSHSTVLKIFENPTPEEVANIRRQEVINASKVLGLAKHDITFLNFEDGSLQNNLEEATQRVIKILKQESDAVRIYCTHERDGHRDHKATGIIVRNAVTLLRLSIPIYFYIIWPTDELGVLEFEQEDISDVLNIKRSAIDQYRSQIEIFTDQQIRPVLLPKFVDDFKNQKTEKFTIFTV